MDTKYTEATHEASGKIQWKRNDVVSNIVDFDQSKQKKSVRQFTIEQGIPRSTFRHWASRKDAIDVSPVKPPPRLN